MPAQGGWRWCRKCQGVYFGAAAGVCSAGGSHDSTGSGDYMISQGAPAAIQQPEWRWCSRCSQLFFGGDGRSGVCPASGAMPGLASVSGKDGHDGSSSGHYVLTRDVPTAHGQQEGWRWCHKCEALHFTGGGVVGRCPAGNNHDLTGSAKYLMTGSHRRALVPDLIRSVVPSTHPEPRFVEFAKDWTGGGTTCGFLCHWLIWSLGAVNAKVVNFSDPARQFKYVDGKNIEKLWNLGRPPFVTENGNIARGDGPRVGDAIMIHLPGVQNSEHVFVYLGEEQVDEGGPVTYWLTAEAGGPNPQKGNRQSAREDRRKLLTRGGEMWLDRPVSGQPQPQKKIMGWLSLDLLDY